MAAAQAKPWLASIVRDTWWAYSNDRVARWWMVGQWLFLPGAGSIQRSR